MAMDVIPKPLYPVVPWAPGIPPMLRSGAAVLDTLTFGVFGLSDALAELLGTKKPQWGVFEASGAPVAIADSVLSVDYKNSSRVSDFPVESGAFASYNKVASPYAARVRLARGGAEDERAAFIAALDEAANSLNLYLILLPDREYHNAVIESVDWRREAGSGAGLVVAELQLREVRQVGVQVKTTPKEPDCVAPQAAGQVQCYPVSRGVVTAVELTKMRSPYERGL